VSCCCVMHGESTIETSTFVVASIAETLT